MAIDGETSWEYNSRVGLPHRMDKLDKMISRPIRIDWIPDSAAELLQEVEDRRRREEEEKKEGEKI